MSRDAGTVLVIEDEPNLVVGLRDALEHHGFEVVVADTCAAGTEIALTGRPDLILLDLMLPDGDGVDVCRALRGRGVSTPVIMLTARSQETDKIEGLDAGADDYVTKPFSVSELLARVRAQLRRNGDRGAPDRVRIGETIVDFKRFTAFARSERHALTEREVSMLRLLVNHPHEVITRDRLLDEVWGLSAYPTTRTIDTFVYRLRQKIESDPQSPEHLLTIRGAGYKFVP